MTTHLTRDDLWSLEEYATKRADFRAEVMAHKKNRQLSLGEHARLYFEDEKTIRYQIQEMLRIERVFEAEGIEEELSAYNPLIPDGHNWKATFMIEIPDPAQRAVRLGEMIGIEDAQHTYEYDKYFKILPSIYGWCDDPKRIKDGIKVPENFTYSSDNNKTWMGVEELQTWLIANGYSID